MTPADTYRIKAAELHAQAVREKNPRLRAEYEKLAKGYLHLAEQADRNSRADICYEPPPLHANRSDINPGTNGSPDR